MNEERLIIEKLLSGFSLRTVMTPDDEIPRNNPLHDEHFDLPHVIINEETFYGITSDSLFTTFEKSQLPVSFYYTTLNNMFGSFSPGSIFNSPDNQLRFNIASKKRYKRHDWRLLDTTKLIWEFKGEKNVDALREAVNLPLKLTAAFLDEENVWNIHPVALPQINHKDNEFILKTHYTIYPYLFRHPQAMTDLIKTKIDNDYFENKDKYQSSLMIGIHKPFVAFYHIRGDGTYKSYYDLSRGNTVNTYTNLKIFAENIG